MAEKQIRQLNSGTLNESPAFTDVIASQVDSVDGTTSPVPFSAVRDLIANGVAEPAIFSETEVSFLASGGRIPIILRTIILIILRR